MSAADRLTLEVVATCFDVQVAWLVEVCETGLVHAVLGADGDWRVEVDDLPRIARIVRLCVHQGVQLDVVELLID